MLVNYNIFFYVLATLQQNNTAVLLKSLSASKDANFIANVRLRRLASFNEFICHVLQVFNSRFKFVT